VDLCPWHLVLTSSNALCRLCKSFFPNVYGLLTALLNKPYINKVTILTAAWTSEFWCRPGPKVVTFRRTCFLLRYGTCPTRGSTFLTTLPTTYQITRGHTQNNLNKITSMKVAQLSCFLRAIHVSVMPPHTHGVCVNTLILHTQITRQCLTRFPA
jgi:hypothetical protein